MQEMKKTILNEEGMHARPAGVLAKSASGFRSKIEILYKGRTINAKSAMSIMTLGLSKGSEIQLSADGPDAGDAIRVLSQLIDNKLQA